MGGAHPLGVGAALENRRQSCAESGCNDVHVAKGSTRGHFAQPIGTAAAAILNGDVFAKYLSDRGEVRSCGPWFRAQELRCPEPVVGLSAKHLLHALKR